MLNGKRMLPTSPDQPHMQRALDLLRDAKAISKQQRRIRVAIG